MEQLSLLGEALGKRCRDCGGPVPKRRGKQWYCLSCGEKRDKACQRLYRARRRAARSEAEVAADRAYLAAYYRENYEARYLANHFRREYGLTLEGFRDLFEKQSGCCAVCERPMEWPTRENGKSKSRAVVDHDHSTGAVRGILHHNCNKGLGMFADEPELLMKAAEYLRASSVGAAA